MTEQEEFEFRARAEAEAQAAAPSAPAEGSTSFKGAMSEINKGIGRGLTALPLAVGGALEKSLPPPTPGALINPPQGDPNVTALRDKLLANLKATPNSKTEQMLGTGAELTAAAVPFAGGAGTIPQKLLGLAMPVAGGVTGEQLGGEQGKMLGALGAPIAGAVIGRALTPTVSPELQILAREGVVPTPGQQTGGSLKKIEGLPVVRDLGPDMGKARARQQFVDGAVNVALRPLGVAPIKEANGMAAFAKADSIATQAYDEILPKLTVKYDPQFSAEMSAQRAQVPQAIRGDLEDIFNREIAGKLTQGSANIPPRTMKQIDSELGRLARRYMKDPAVNSQNIADGIRDMQGAFRDMVTRQNPELAPELQKINATWNNLLRVENAVVKAANAEGNFTPEQFQSAVKQMDASLRKGAFAKGQAAMQSYSNAGVNVLGGEGATNVPYSAVNNLARGLAAGGAGVAGATNPGLAIPAAAAAGTFASMYTPIGQKLAQVALTGPRPPMLQTLGQAFRNAPPGPALGTVPLFTQGEQ